MMLLFSRFSGSLMRMYGEAARTRRKGASWWTMYICSNVSSVQVCSILSFVKPALLSRGSVG